MRLPHVRCDDLIEEGHSQHLLCVSMEVTIGVLLSIISTGIG